jgi:hypothetical protein
MENRAIISLNPGEVEALSRAITDKGYEPFFRAKYSVPQETVRTSILENQKYATLMGIPQFPLIIANTIMATSPENPLHSVRFILNWSEAQGLHVSGLELERQACHEGFIEVALKMEIDSPDQIPAADRANAMLVDKLNQSRENFRRRWAPDSEKLSNLKYQGLIHRAYDLTDFLEMMKQKGYADLMLDDEFTSIRAGHLPASPKRLVADMFTTEKGPVQCGKISFSIEYSPVYKFRLKEMKISRYADRVYASVSFSNIQHNKFPSLAQLTKLLDTEHRIAVKRNSRCRVTSYEGWNRSRMGRKTRL